MNIISVALMSNNTWDAHFRFFEHWLIHNKEEYNPKFVPVGRCTHLISDILMHTYFGFQIMD
jgi:hypothetical protein